MRTFNRLLAALLGLALAVTGLLICLEIGTALVGRSPSLVPYDRWMESAGLFSWSASETMWVSSGILAAGLTLLAIQLAPRRPRNLNTSFAIPKIEVVVDRVSLEQSLSRAALGVEGVVEATSRANKRRIRTTIDVAGGENGEVSEQVRRVLTTRLADFQVSPVREISVTARTKGRAR